MVPCHSPSLYLITVTNVVLCHPPSRQRALKALDDRLSKNTEPISWPTLDDAGSSSPDEQSPATGTQGLSAVVVEKSPGVPSSSSSSPPSNGEGGSTATPGPLSSKPPHIKGSPVASSKTDSSASVKIESA